MLHLYGTPLSYPTNKIRYLANYLHIPFTFNVVNLAAGEQKKPEFLAINPIGRVPAIDDNGFKLAESNAILRYLATKQQSDTYPNDLKKRAIIDQWMDFISLHITAAISKIWYNTHIYKLRGDTRDERSFQEGHKFLAHHLPQIEQQLAQNKFVAGNTLSIADINLLASLDPCELIQVELTKYPNLIRWRNKLIQEAFYTSCFDKSYTDTFNQAMMQRQPAQT